MCNNRYSQRYPGMGHPFYGSTFERKESFRVPVNIHKTDTGYELLVFAPDRSKDDFKITMTGHELTISYELKKEAAESHNWIRHEFSKSSFERTFLIDETVDTENIKAEYTNGILQLTLPVIPGSEKPAQEIKVY